MQLTKKRLQIPRKYKNRDEKCWENLKQRRNLKKKKMSPSWGETEKCVVNRLHVDYKEVMAVM